MWLVLMLFGVAARIGGAPERGAGAPLAGMRPCRCRESRVDSARRVSRSGVASKQNTLGTCSALHATHRCSTCQYSGYWLHRAPRHHQFWTTTHARFIMSRALITVDRGAVATASLAAVERLVGAVHDCPEIFAVRREGCNADADRREHLPAIAVEW